MGKPKTTAARLRELAGQIQTEDQACMLSARATLDHAVRAGRLLQEAKALVGHGEWLPWLKQKCLLSERTARRYMSLARLDPAKLADLKKPTMRAALVQIVRDLKPDDAGYAREVITQKDGHCYIRPSMMGVQRTSVPFGEDHRLDEQGHPRRWTPGLDGLEDDDSCREANIRVIEKVAGELLAQLAQGRRHLLQSEQRARLRTVAQALLDALDPVRVVA